jgi:hypothetical protein
MVGPVSLTSTISALAAYGLITLVWYLKPERRRVVYVAMPSPARPAKDGASRGLRSHRSKPSGKRILLSAKGWWALLVQVAA